MRTIWNNRITFSKWTCSQLFWNCSNHAFGTSRSYCEQAGIFRHIFIRILSTTQMFYKICIPFSSQRVPLAAFRLTHRFDSATKAPCSWPHSKLPLPPWESHNLHKVDRDCNCGLREMKSLKDSVEDGETWESNPVSLPEIQLRFGRSFFIRPEENANDLTFLRHGKELWEHETWEGEKSRAEPNGSDRLPCGSPCHTRREGVNDGQVSVHNKGPHCSIKRFYLSKRNAIVRL